MPAVCNILLGARKPAQPQVEQDGMKSITKVFVWQRLKASSCKGDYIGGYLTIMLSSNWSVCWSSTRASCSLTSAA